MKTKRTEPFSLVVMNEPKIRILPGSSAVVQPHDRYQLVFETQVDFRPLGVLFDRRHASCFAIEGIFVGTRHEFVSAGSVPAALFVDACKLFPLDLTTLLPGVHLSLNLRNVSDVAVPALAGVFGVANWTSWDADPEVPFETIADRIQGTFQKWCERLRSAQEKGKP